MKKFSLLLLLAASFSMASEPFVIARAGKAETVISVPENPAPSTLYAAKELSTYFSKICGGTFEIVTNAPAGTKAIRLGGAYSASKPEEIFIHAETPKSLIVTGEGKRGTIYAAYRLLEKLGCGFWAPDNETVPSSPDITVEGGFKRIDAPAFLVRQPHGESTFFKVHWKAKMAINGDMFVKRIPEELGGHQFYDISQSMAGFSGEGDNVTNLVWHPEWFAWNNAQKKRVADQFCTTDQGLRDEILRRVRNIMARDPNRKQISLSFNDGYNFCECKNCSKIRKEEGICALQVDLANYIGKEVADEFPELRLITFAYDIYLKPPPTMKLEPNVDICFANIQRNYAIPPCESPKNNEYLTKWTELTGTNIYIWGYNAQFKSFLTPYPIIDTLGPEIRSYRDFGVKGVYIQMAEGNISDFIDLRCWLAAKLLWNPDQDEMALMKQWCEGACGAGAPYVYQWLEECKKIRQRCKYIGLYAGDTRDYFTAEDLLLGNELLGKAVEAVRDDPRAFKQVTELNFSVRFALLVRYNHDIMQTAKEKGITLPSRKELVNEVIDFSRARRNGCYAEGYGWSAIVPRFRHGEVIPEKKGDKPRRLGEWTFRNPVVSGVVYDPYVVFDKATGYYYGIRTEGNAFYIRRAARAVDLFASINEATPRVEEVLAWKVTGQGGITERLRGPELHKGPDGKWRIYACGGGVSFALEGEVADEGAENSIFVLEAKGGNPFGEFEFKTTFKTGESAVDPTVFYTDKGKGYICYGRESFRQSLKIRELDSPTKLGPKEGIIIGAKSVDELPISPSIIKMADGIYLVYGKGGLHSGKAKVQVHKLVGSNILSPRSWKKCKSDLLVSGNSLDAAGYSGDQIITGPRALSFFRSSDDSELWCAYRGWTRAKLINPKADMGICIQQVDRMPTVDSGYTMKPEITPLLIQPSGDRGRSLSTVTPK